MDKCSNSGKSSQRRERDRREGVRDQKLHAAVARSVFPSQNVKNMSRPEQFLADVEKVYATVAPSAFPSQNAKALQCRCTFRSWAVEKCTLLYREAHVEKRFTSEAILAVEMSKKFTQLWREARFQVKSVFSTLGWRFLHPSESRENVMVS